MTICLIIALIILILNPNIASSSVISSSLLWFNKLIGVLLPTMLITDLIINSKLLYFISDKLFFPFHKIFNIRYKKSVLLIIISILCGAPSATRLIVDSYDNNEIDFKECQALIIFMSFLSLPYISYILNILNINILYFLLPSLFISIIFMKIYNRGTIGKTNYIYHKTNVINTFFQSINKSINVLLVILIIMICFNITISLFNINEYTYFLFEPLKGHELITNIKNIRLRNSLMLLSLNILGLSPIIQIKYVSSKTNLVHLILYKLISSIPFLFYLIIVLIS